MENYYQAKKKLYYMAREYCLINTDDEYGKRLYGELLSDGIKAFSFGENEDADYRLDVRKMGLDGSEFSVSHEGRTYTFKIRTIGKFNIYNVLPSVIMAIREGYAADDIKTALLKHTGTNGRMERVKEGVFIDYAHTPDAMENVLSLLKETSDRKITCIFGCGGDRDHSKRPKMGRMAEKYADSIIITMDNPRSEDNDDIMNAILEGIDDKDRVRVISDRASAIKEAVRNRADDEVVIVLGKGHETYQEIGDRKIYFSDRDEILKA
jgi:UDP-N-acetylmuramoyl-L-alanyl-D-glutamate--2,6-diaminopimelate ligase